MYTGVEDTMLELGSQEGNQQVYIKRFECRIITGKVYQYGLNDWFRYSARM
jgi:hypothetical protein